MFVGWHRRGCSLNAGMALASVCSVHYIQPSAGKQMLTSASLLGSRAHRPEFTYNLLTILPLNVFLAYPHPSPSNYAPPSLWFGVQLLSLPVPPPYHLMDKWRGSEHLCLHPKPPPTHASCQSCQASPGSRIVYFSEQSESNALTVWEYVPNDFNMIATWMYA